MSFADIEPDFSDEANLRVDIQRLVLQLPTMQRIAVQKWMRDERLTAAERMSLTRAKRNLMVALDGF